MRATLGWLGWAGMLAVLVASFIYESSPLADEVLCVFRRTLGLPCPGCGLTRSFCAMARLDIVGAFGFHLAGPWLWLTAAAAVALRPMQHLLGWGSVWERAPRLVNFWFLLFAVLFIANTVRWAGTVFMLVR